MIQYKYCSKTFDAFTCLHVQTTSDFFWRAGFFPANYYSFLKAFQLALISVLYTD